jgi:hypothetical protein
MTGYFQTPNANIPLNQREPGEIAEIAKEQLAQWEEIAQAWELSYRDDTGYVRCLKCEQTIYRSHDDNGIPYMMIKGEKLALTVAHIRQVHAEVINAGK